jgi:hypothetical protein
MSRLDTSPQRYTIIDTEREEIVPGLESFGPDYVPAWRDVKNAHHLCDRCRAIPWHLFEFEEHDFDNPGSYSVSTRSSQDSLRESRSEEDAAPMSDTHRREESTVSSVNDRGRHYRSSMDLDSQSGISVLPPRALSEGSSPRALSEGSFSPSPSELDRLPLSEEFTRTDPSSGLHLVDSENGSGSFRYSGHNFRPHISRPDPMGPYIKFWDKQNGPSLAEVREAAHQGCHLCTLIVASFLTYRLNRVFESASGSDCAMEVFDSNTILLTGRVFRNKADGSQSRYLLGRIAETGRGDGIRFRFPILDEEELSDSSSKVRREVIAASPAESIANFWLQDCLANHDCSHDPNEDPFLPSRVINVLGVDNQREPVLLETNGMIRAKYAALSYRWGKCKLFRTTETNYAERCQSIPLETLPMTFKDTIRMTIALGLQYLWIDALCIIQDSAEDCQRELKSMANIYTNATITIAAIGATSADSGFSLNHNKLAMIDCRVFPGTVISANFEGQDSLLDSGTLHSRAWCFQEVQLAPRLLSCGAKELYFQCHRGLCREGSPLDFLFDKGRGPKRSRFCDYQPMTDPAETYELWYKCVRAYSERNLTYPSDKLSALSGLASRFPRLFKDDAERPTPQDYLAGLWRADLLKGLLRENIFNPQQRQPVAYRAPSWSWAATDAGTFGFGSKTNDHFYCQVLEAKTTLVSDLNPFGPVRSGKLTIYGPIAPLPAFAFYQDEIDKDPANSRHGFTMVGWDHDVSRDLGCVCLLFTEKDVLVLSPVRRPGARTGLYQRVGKLGPQFPQFDNFEDEARIHNMDWKMAVVTLI